NRRPEGGAKGAAPCLVPPIGRNHLGPSLDMAGRALCMTPSLRVQLRLSRARRYAAHARANARGCSLGYEPEVSSSRVCLPPSSLTNESSQYVVGAVQAILTVSCSRKSRIDN